MKILLDECLPRPLKKRLPGHEVKTVQEMGWQTMKNGSLMKRAVDEKFELFLTSDKNLEFQQNLTLYDIAVVVFDVVRNKIEFLVPLLRTFNDRLSNFEKGKANRNFHSTFRQWQTNLHLNTTSRKFSTNSSE